MASMDTLEDNTAFAKKEQADFPILADPAKQAATAYGVLSERGFARRWTFYIGPDGTIKAIDTQVNPQTAGETVTAKLKELGVPARKK